MYMVYWTQWRDGATQACSQAFGANELKETLQFMETLRKRQREQRDLGFVTFVSELPDSVGLPGVAETGADYDWKKRR